MAAVKAMFSRRCSCLVVTREGRVCGILTERDVVRLVATEADSLAGQTVGDAMTSPVETIPPETTVVDVAQLMKDRRVRRFPVVASDGTLLGLVTGTDVVTAAKRALEQSAHRLEREVEVRTRSLQIANHELARLSVTDPLTGLYNRRCLFEHIDKQITHLQKRKAGSLSCIMIDVDHFKNVNDTYGHNCGDRVLVHIGKIIYDSVRLYDFVARYGGEEFIVVMRADEDGALAAAERLRAVTASEPFSYGNSQFGVTLSAGVAHRSFPHSELNADHLVAEADTALYHAKNSGRNRIELASRILAA